MRTGIFNVKGWEMEVVHKNCLDMVPCDKIQVLHKISTNRLFSKPFCSRS